MMSRSGSFGKSLFLIVRQLIMAVSPQRRIGATPSNAVVCWRIKEILFGVQMLDEAHVSPNMLECRHGDNALVCRLAMNHIVRGHDMQMWAQQQIDENDTSKWTSVLITMTKLLMGSC